MAKPGPRCLSCARCCTVWASSGVVFLFFVGTLLQKQPLYVMGIDDAPKSAKSCFAAAWMYLTIVIISIVTLAYDKMQRSERPQGAYTRVPEYGAISYKNEL
mmetsp:Transcript_23686/g.71040  ORF Transcript_23686/g.71040 Transcript_23686/m.71040 type:complete len:102 (-) Transcript_23686:41-346(-)